MKTEASEQEKLEVVSGSSSRRIVKANDGSRLGSFVEDGAAEIGELYTKVKGRNATARLIVRDCHLQRESAEKLERVNTGLYMTE